MKSGDGYTMMKMYVMLPERTLENGSDGKFHVMHYFATIGNCEIPENESIINIASYATNGL